MKNFIVKIFLFVCAIVFLAEGVLLSLVCLKRVSPNDISVFYRTLFPDSIGTGRPDSIGTGFAIAFLCIGFILLYNAMRSTGQARTIIIKDRGETVRIPVATIKDFINQIIEKNSHLNNVHIKVDKKGKWVYVHIVCTYTGYTPVRGEMSAVKEILRSEIKRVFEFSYLKIDFHLAGVRAGEYPAREEEAREGPDSVVGSSGDEEGLRNEDVSRDTHLEEEPPKAAPWEG